MLVKEEAKLDILAAAAQYARANKSLGTKFINTIQDKLKTIEQFPGSNSIVYKQVRRAIITSFPYSIYYMIENDDVIVYAILHNHAGIRTLLQKINQVKESK